MFCTTYLVIFNIFFLFFLLCNILPVKIWIMIINFKNWFIYNNLFTFRQSKNTFYQLQLKFQNIIKLEQAQSRLLIFLYFFVMIFFNYWFKIKLFCLKKTCFLFNITYVLHYYLPWYVYFSTYWFFCNVKFILKQIM